VHMDVDGSRKHLVGLAPGRGNKNRDDHGRCRHSLHDTTIQHTEHLAPIYTPASRDLKGEAYGEGT